MIKKIICGFFMMGLCAYSLADIPNLDSEILKNSKIEANSPAIESVSNISKEERQKILDAKIEFLKQDIQKWKDYQTKLIDYQKEMQSSYDLNEEKIKTLTSEIDDLRKQIDKSSDTITQQTQDIEIGQTLVDVADEIVTFDLPDGKKIRLIKHTVFPGERLIDIAVNTFDGDYNKKELAFRKQAIIKLNKNINKKTELKSGQVIYIPFFKK